MNCYVYMLRRGGGEIKFLCKANCKTKFERNPDINKLNIDYKIKDLVKSAVEQNKLLWELYAEAAKSEEEIIENWAKRGLEIKTKKLKSVIPDQTSNRRITRKITFRL